jgi:hypothetical protein
MRAAIMQPYFFPYIGYFQLIASVDVFVIYDNIKYTKKGWINRNRMLLNGSDAMFSLPLRKDSDSLDVVQREISPDFDREKLLNQLRGAYRSAPFFKDIFPLLEKVIQNTDSNLFRYIRYSVEVVCEALGIKTKIVTFSDLSVGRDLKSQDKVIAICKAVGADAYINSIGGVNLYEKKAFSENGINLSFLKPRPLDYAQFGGEFVPWLSIIDVMMFNPMGEISKVAHKNFDLV